MNIAILTQPLLCNYGGILQNYALQHILKTMGHKPITIDVAELNHTLPVFRVVLSRIKTFLLKKVLHKNRPYMPFSKPRVRPELFNLFVREYINVTDPCLRPSVTIMNNNAIDCVIVGSDQVWRPKYNIHLQDQFLNFCKGKKYKSIAYAASFGVDTWEYSQKQTATCSKLAQKFNAISVREKSGIELCKNYFGIHADWVLDPTLLLTKEDYCQLCHNIPPAKEKFIAVYVLNMNESIRSLYESIASEKKLGVKFFSAYSEATITIPEWIAMFRDASYIVTDSFHGTVLSIIFKKEFKCLYNQSRGSSRFESLLELYNSGKLDEMRLFSLNWLKNALNVHP